MKTFGQIEKVYIEKVIPESNRIVVERAVNFSKELDSKWREGDEKTSDKSVAKLPTETRFTVCRNGRR
jgi:hypothetical protein